MDSDSITAINERIAAMGPIPDGIFAANDQSAAACIQVLKEKRISIPKDIFVAGFNNDPISVLVEPKLTTINYPGVDMGVVAATYLTRQLAGAEETNNTNSIALNSELIVRESSLKKGTAKK